MSNGTSKGETATNLLEYLGVEETNLLVSMANFHRDVHFFREVDGLFQAPLPHIDVKVKDFDKLTPEELYSITVMTLFLFTQFHLYLSTTLMLRCHLSDSLASTRKAIDATLTAYRLMRFPHTVADYNVGHKSYKFIKSTIDRESKQDASRYPLAGLLIEFHELCSEYGSHADVGSFIHRLKVEHTGTVNKQMLKHVMFQLPEDPREQRYYLVRTFLIFCVMAKVYVDFMPSVAPTFDSKAWSARIEQIGNSAQAESDRISAAISGGP